MPQQYAFEVKPEDALRRADLAILKRTEHSGKESETEETIPPVFLGLGQERFFAALATGIAVREPFHNVYVVGEPGPNGFAAVENAVRVILKESMRAKKRLFPAFKDWCFVHNFKDSRNPEPISFKKGGAVVFRDAIRKARLELEKKIPLAVSGKEIKMELTRLEETERQWRARAEEEVEGKAILLGFMARRKEENHSAEISFELASALAREEGAPPAPMSDEELAILSASEKEKNALKKHELMVVMQEFAKGVNERAAVLAARAKELQDNAAHKVIDTVFISLGARKPRKNIALSRFLHGLWEHTSAHYEEMFLQENEDEDKKDTGMLESVMQVTNDPLLPWEVNVFVDNSETIGIPVLAKRIATIEEFAGKIDYIHVFGISYSDHTNIRSGIAAEANGGILIIDAHDLLMVNGLWDLIKKYIRNQSLTFETESTLLGLNSPEMRPQPIPLEIRVVLFGEEWLMDKLAHLDPEFLSLFSVRAEIKQSVSYSEAQVAAYGNWLARAAKNKEAISLSPSGAARLIEHAGRLATNQQELSTDFAALLALLAEARAHAKNENTDEISDAHVEKAIQERFWRSSILHERLHEQVRDGTVILSVSGKKAGQVNGLMFLSSPDVSFGFPMRITAVTSYGTPGVVNIQRGADLAGKILHKADLTVQGLLKARFAQDFPLALEVLFSFEQTYGRIEGDSASLAEYIVILSSISGVPLKQTVAITGSVNIHGEVQPISGVNEKIEGFFDVCATKGALSGEQGVIIPWQNKKNLMLREDVVEAIREGKFHVWAIPTLEDGIAILTGKDPEEVEKMVTKKLREYSEKSRKHSRKGEK